MAFAAFRSAGGFSPRADSSAWLLGMFQAHAEEASPSQHVRDLGKRSGSALLLVLNVDRDILAFPQEDDIDGEHIVAFAEEDDPGVFLCR